VRFIIVIDPVLVGHQKIKAVRTLVHPSVFQRVGAQVYRLKELNFIVIKLRIRKIHSKNSVAFSPSMRGTTSTMDPLRPGALLCMEILVV